MTHGNDILTNDIRIGAAVNARRIESKAWEQGQERFSAEWRKFSDWIKGCSWRAKPQISEAAKADRKSVVVSSSGTDANAEYVPKWRRKLEVA